MSTYALESLSVRELIGGDNLNINIFRFKGSDPKAKKVYIQSSVHASEVQGYLVALKLIDYFSSNSPKGDVVIVPIANPYAINLKLGEYTSGRFDLINGENYNRHYIDLSTMIDYQEFYNSNKTTTCDDIKAHFKALLKSKMSEYIPTSYASRLNHALQNLALEADIALDLHCDTHSIPHVYSPNYLVDKAKLLGIKHIVSIEPKFCGAFDEAIFMPWCKLMDLYREYERHIKDEIAQCVMSFTVELGDQELIDSESAEKQALGIIKFLKCEGVVEDFNLSDPLIGDCFVREYGNFISIFAPNSGLVVNKAKIGDVVSNGEMLIELSNIDKKVGVNKSFICHHKDAVVIAVTNSAIILEGMQVMKVMEL